MANARLEFHDDEQDLMWEVFSSLEYLLGPRAPKPPQRTPEGKWHFYLETPDHKRKTKENRKLHN